MRPVPELCTLCERRLRKLPGTKVEEYRLPMGNILHQVHQVAPRQMWSSSQELCGSIHLSQVWRSRLAWWAEADWNQGISRRLILSLGYKNVRGLRNLCVNAAPALSQLAQEQLMRELVPNASSITIGGTSGMARISEVGRSCCPAEQMTTL